MRTLASTPEAWSLWLDGRFDSRTDRQLQRIWSPSDGTEIAQVEQADRTDVVRAVDIGVSAAAEYRNTPRHVRAAQLTDAADRFDSVVEYFTESLVALIGKPRRMAQAEARRGSDILRRCAAELNSLHGENLSLDAVPGGEGRLGVTWREALGLVAAITPFNAPINLMMQKLGPALAMGNAVIVKPAHETAVVTLQIIEAIAGAFPSGVIGVVCGEADTATDLITSPRVDAVSFTGGVAAGEAVHRNAGIKPVLLELGSNAPNLVLADADLEDAAARLTQASFGASGQQCISAQRIIVDQAVRDDFVGRLLAAANQLVVGNPAETETDLGPMVHTRARDRVVSMIDDATERGSQILLDGRRPGLYLHPTVLLDPPSGARLLAEEVFGPVVIVMTSRDTDHAIEIANAIDLGLQAACFTNEISSALHVAKSLRCGSVWINEASRFRLDTYPFGGVGRSGLGREGVRYAMEELSYVKFVGIRPASR